jgi:hypothetical protein
MLSVLARPETAGFFIGGLCSYLSYPTIVHRGSIVQLVAMPGPAATIGARVSLNTLLSPMEILTSIALIMCLGMGLKRSKTRFN